KLATKRQKDTKLYLCLCAFLWLNSAQGGHLERQSFCSYGYGLVPLRGHTVGAPLTFRDFRHGEAHHGDRYPDENRLDQSAHCDRDGSQRRRREDRSLDIRK